MLFTQPYSSSFRVDVIIPYHPTNLPYLCESVNSILNQNDTECIVHIVNDGFDIEDDPAIQYSHLHNVRMYRNVSQMGPYNTVNSLANRLETDFVAIHDSDDIAMPNRMKISIESLIEEEADIFGGSMENFVSHDRRSSEMEEIVKRGSRITSGHTMWHMQPFGNIINGTLVMRKSAFEKLGGYMSVPCSGDGEFSTRCYKSDLKVITKDVVVGLRRLHSTSLSHAEETGIRSKMRSELHRKMFENYDLMTPGFDPKEFGGLREARYSPYQTKPISDNASLKNLEFHVSHSCNLSCMQCSHYSNNKHTGMATADDTRSQFSLWNRKLLPEKISLLGGEPTLNPELVDIIYITREMWPHSKLLLVTNGFFLHKFLDLPKALEETGCYLDISVHHSSPEYQKAIEPARKLVDEWSKEYFLKVNWRESFSKWRRTYKGTCQNMSPYTDDNPRKSWNICKSKWCLQLHEGMLWKCPQLAYLKMQLQKVGKLDSDEWQPYVQYKPLSHNNSIEKIREFVSRQVEDVCGMCPAKHELFELQLPIRGQ